MSMSFANNPLAIWWAGAGIDEELSSPWVGHAHYQIQLLAQHADLYYFRIGLQGIVTWAGVLVMLFQLVPNSIRLQLESVYISAMALLTGTVAYLGKSHLSPMGVDHLRAHMRGLPEDREQNLLEGMERMLHESRQALVDWFCSLEAQAGCHVEEVITALAGASAATDEQERITFVACATRFFQSVLEQTQRSQFGAAQHAAGSDNESEWSEASPMYMARAAGARSGPSAGN